MFTLQGGFECLTNRLSSEIWIYQWFQKPSSYLEGYSPSRFSFMLQQMLIFLLLKFSVLILDSLKRFSTIVVQTIEVKSVKNPSGLNFKSIRHL